MGSIYDSAKYGWIGFAELFKELKVCEYYKKKQILFGFTIF